MYRLRANNVPAPVKNPYADGGTARKVWIHGHSNWNGSDGAETPQAIADALIARSYDAMILTDHNKAGAGQTPTGIVFVRGVEEDDHSAEPSAAHILGMNLNTEHDNTTYSDQTLTQVCTALKAEGNLIAAAHPSWETAPWTEAELLANRPHLFEVWNYANELNAEELWDTALAFTGTPMWCFAGSDIHEGAPTAGDPWTMVFTPTLNAAEIVASLRAGNCYATQGNLITSIAVSGVSITVVVPNSSNIVWKKTGGATAQTDNGVTTSTYALTPSDLYARAVITRASDSKIAWTQPFFLR